MPINKVVEGDLIQRAKEGSYNVIIQGCNCNCVMGSGLAPQIAKAFPEAEVADNATQRGAKGKLGNFTRGVNRGYGQVLHVINLYTQFGTGGFRKGKPDIDYKALFKGFKRINYEYGDFEDYKIGIPMIGAGLAGGHWEAIELLINMATPDLDIELVVYKPRR